MLSSFVTAAVTLHPYLAFILHTYLIQVDSLSTMNINGGSGVGIPKSSIFNLIVFPRVFTHKTEMRAPWSALVRNLLGLVILVNIYMFTSTTRTRKLRTSADQGAYILTL